MIPNGQKGKRIFKRLRLSESRRCCDFFPLCLGCGFQYLLYLNFGPFLARSGITGFRHIDNI